MFVDFVIDFWWFRSLELGGYYLWRMMYRYLVFFLFTALFFSVFYVNFWVASRFVGFVDSSAEKKDLIRYLHHGLRRLYLPISFLMAFFIAIPTYSSWEQTLLFLFGGNGGGTDPLFGRDIGLYLFSLPFYTLIQKEILIAFSLLFTGVAFMYWYEHRLLTGEDKALPRAAKIHISLLFLMVIGIVCWGFMLQRYQLLYSTNNLPVFFGPGYVEMRIHVPLIWL